MASNPNKFQFRVSHSGLFLRFGIIFFISFNDTRTCVFVRGGMTVNRDRAVVVSVDMAIGNSIALSCCVTELGKLAFVAFSVIPDDLQSFDDIQTSLTFIGLLVNLHERNVLNTEPHKLGIRILVFCT
jgi:hypothetical protein